MAHYVIWHGRCCSEGEAFPHQPSESATVSTLDDAVNAVPRGAIGYVNWTNPRRRWIVNRDGTLTDHRERKNR